MNPLAAFRKRHLLTQAEAAAAVGLDPSSWRQIETGFRGREPTRSLLLHLAALDRLARKGLPWPGDPNEDKDDDVDDDQI